MFFPTASPPDEALHVFALFLAAGVAARRRLAGRAGSHRPVCCLSWPPDRYTKTPRGRPSRQQLWERALQDHIMNRHELPQASACTARPGGDQENPSTGRSHTRSSPSSRRLVLPRQPRPLKTGPAAVHRSAARSTSTPSPATGSSTCWTSGRPSGDGTCRGACARSSVCAPGCSTGSTRTLPTTGNGARHEQRRSTGELCCHPQTRRD